jgi:hypothetical protein
LTELQSLYLCEPTPPDERLVALARAYHDRTEAYDRTVCTGPIGRDGIMPATPREFGLINRNAALVKNELTMEAERLGFTRAELQREIFHYEVHR